MTLSYKYTKLNSLKIVLEAKFRV